LQPCDGRGPAIAHPTRRADNPGPGEEEAWPRRKALWLAKAGCGESDLEGRANSGGAAPKAGFRQVARRKMNRSPHPCLRSRETREDSKLILEATKQ
jgi:hypothetical protein